MPNDEMYDGPAAPTYPPTTPAESWLDELGHKWLTYWHGDGASNQYRYYRCNACQHLVTHRQIAAGGCAYCAKTRISPAYLRPMEKLRLLCLPWTIK